MWYMCLVSFEEDPEASEARDGGADASTTVAGKRKEITRAIKMLPLWDSSHIPVEKKDVGGGGLVAKMKKTYGGVRRIILDQSQLNQLYGSSGTCANLEIAAVASQLQQ